MEAHDRVHEIPAAAFFTSCMIFTSSHAGLSTTLPVIRSCSLVSISMPSSLRWLLCCMLLLHVWYTSTCLIYIYLIMHQLFLYSKFYSEVNASYLLTSIHHMFHLCIINPRLSMYSSKVNILLVFIKFILLQRIRNYY
jgi:hypothetical protein